MFELNYQIVLYDYDDFIGQNGFFRVKCNDFVYEEIYPEGAERYICQDSDALYDWMERFVRVCICLMTKEYVVLSNIESYNTWIEFKKRGDKLSISLIEAKKEEGTHDIEFHLDDRRPGEWTNQIIDFQQFKGEIIQKGKAYLKTTLRYEPENACLNKLKDEIEELEAM